MKQRIETIFPAQWLAGCLVLVLSLSPVLTLAPEVSAGGGQTFTVNTTDDTVDIEGCQALPGDCTLREAITAANLTLPADQIRFNIAGEGVHTITATGQLPAITSPVTIDGYSQPGAKTNRLTQGTDAVLLIELDGQNTPAGNDALVINAGPTIIRGLVINRFKENNGGGGNAIVLSSIGGNTHNVIEGNFIGTDPTGLLELANQSNGVVLTSPSSFDRIGGPDVADRNLIAGNWLSAVLVNDSQATVQGNILGADKSGALPIPNGEYGVEINGFDNLVMKNLIAFNALDGVQVATGEGNLIRQNSIFSNTLLGINLGLDARTLNDVGPPPDLDGGPNTLQNFPVLTSAKRTKRGTKIRGTLQSTPHSRYSLEFFSNPALGDEGLKYLGKTTVETDNAGAITFGFKTKQKIPSANTITATAASTFGGTSELSDPVSVP